MHLRAIDEPQRSPTGRFAPEQDVAGDVEIVEEVELLVDERDPEGRRRGHAADRHRRAVDQQLARVGLFDPADDLHQRRLAGAVLAEQRHDLAGVHLERDAAQGVDARESLLDPPELQ